MSRLYKSSSERIYLLSASQVSVEHWIFKVRGQSNKIYEQNLKTISFSCSCPDHAIRKSFCKHLLFLISRVAINPSLARELYNDKSKWGLDVFNILNKVWVERLQSRINTKEEKCFINIESQYRGSTTVWFVDELFDVRKKLATYKQGSFAVPQ